MNRPTTENCQLKSENSGEAAPTEIWHNATPTTFTESNAHAVAEDRKTHTRRIITPTPDAVEHYTKANGDPGTTLRCYNNPKKYAGCASGWSVECSGPFNAPGKIGDILYVREPYYQQGYWKEVEGVLTPTGKQKWQFIPANDSPIFTAPKSFRKSRHSDDPYTIAYHKRLGRFMPKKYARTFLKITDVRIERLQDISEEDALAEGIKKCKNGYVAEGTTYDKAGLSHTCPTIAFAILWDSINGNRKGCTWSDNPWVWVVQFERLKNHIVDPNKKVNAHDLIKPEVIDEVINTPLPLETKQILDHHNSGKEPQ